MYLTSKLGPGQRKKGKFILLELLNLLFGMVGKCRLHTNVLRLKTAYVTLHTSKRVVVFPTMFVFQCTGNVNDNPCHVIRGIMR